VNASSPLAAQRAAQRTSQTDAPATSVSPATSADGALSSESTTPVHPDDSTGRPSVALRAAVVVLGAFPALAGLDLTVRPGEIVVLRGPNGAGKTTLLRVCAGLLPLTSGRAVVLGHDLAKHRKRIRRDVGFLSHAGFLYDDLSVEENIRFAVRAGGGSDATIREAMDRVGLDGRVAKISVHSCSAGQRRRTSLAITIARRPRLWLLDEPHAGLDAASRDLLDDVVRVAASHNATVLLASHDDDRSNALATRTLHFTGGHISQDQTHAK
jgi:heme ABC exporter ATP-binding subunit CcmA